MPYYLNKKQLKKIGFKKIGKNCKISRLIRGYSLKCEIGDNVRIDDDVVLKGRITIKSNVHIARGCTLSGGDKGIFMDNFSTLSNFCQIFTKSDDYFQPCISGGTLNQVNQKKFSIIHSKKISIGKVVIVGAFSILLPGAKINDFSSIGAFSLLKNNIKSGFFFSNFENENKKLKKRNLSKIKKIYQKAVSKK